MADTTLLRSSAIVRHASIGAPPPHGPVKTGALPLVQVRMVPGGPQVQQGQQKPVEILPPRDAQSAVAIGGLPLVQVKMTANGPQLEDGIDHHQVVIKDAKHAGVSAGGLPMIQVKMDGGKPQVQTRPNVQGGPPQIPAAPPALSAPRGAAPGARAVARIPAPSRQVAVPVVALPTVPELSTDQLMLCRHVVDKYLADLLVVPSAAPADALAELPPKSAAVTLAEETIVTLDEALIATAVRAAAAAEAAAAGVVTTLAPVVALPKQAFAAATSISPAPAVSYVAGRVGGHTQGGYTGGVRSQRNSGMAPRRVARPGSPHPPVIVKMDGKRPVVQAVAPEASEIVVAELMPVTATEAPEGTAQD